jgi:hypothetical protein
MYEAVALICFIGIRAPVCVTWRDEKNPYPTFESCDRATDRFLETSEARFNGMGHMTIRAGCLQLPVPEKESSL